MSLTSVVHDFAVLYSTRVRQKDKRWSDGRLRFYEFNNKLEVFSEDNLLVASDFYPHASRNPLEHGVFGDGETYQLPGGKLVIEFSEYVGCSIRDISNAFQKGPVKREGRASPIVEEYGPPLLARHDTRTKSAAPQGPGKPQRRRVGLTRKSRQVELTSLVKVSVEDKLNHYQSRAEFTGRIPSGSNRMSLRLLKLLGIDSAASGPPRVTRPSARTSDVTRPSYASTPSFVELDEGARACDSTGTFVSGPLDDNHVQANRSTQIKSEVTARRLLASNIPQVEIEAEDEDNNQFLHMLQHLQ